MILNMNNFHSLIEIRNSFKIDVRLDRICACFYQLRASSYSSFQKSSSESTNNDEAVYFNKNDALQTIEIRKTLRNHFLRAYLFHNQSYR